MKHLLLILIIFAGACGQSQPPSAGAIEVGVLKGPTAMSLIGLLDQPPLLQKENQKYRVHFTVKANPKLLQAELLQQKPDIAVIPTTMAALLYNKGLPYQAAAVTVWGTLVLVGKKPFDWNNLQGKEVHLMGKGLTPDILFQLIAKNKGLMNPANDQPGLQVNYRFPAPQDLAQAMAAGVVDLAVLSEPMASIVLARNKELHVLADLTTEWNNAMDNKIPLIQAVVIVKTSFARKHGQLLERFLIRYSTAVDQVITYKQRAAQLMVKHGLVPETAIGVAAIPRCHLGFRLAHEIKKHIHAYLEVFFKMNPNIVGGRLPDEGFYYRK